MYLQAPDISTGNAGEQSKYALSHEHKPEQPHLSILNGSAAFPFGTPRDVSKITGQAYLTSQQLVQQVGYSLSDTIFSYSPETFDLDTAAKIWSSDNQSNAYGRSTTITSLETRTGAASVLLGYVFSSDRDLAKRNVPQTVIASTATLLEMQNALEQLSMLYSVSSPFVAHVAAVDYSPFQYNLVADYVSALQVAQDAGIALVASKSAHEAQHMALFSTLVSSVLPTVHIYDGVRAGRETAKVVDVLDQAGIYQTYRSILAEQKSVGKKVDHETKVARILENLNSELGTEYKLFEYAGHAEPEAVLVVFGSVESSVSTQVAAKLAAGGEKVGVISVRVYRPFSEQHFLEALPKSVKRVAVLGQVTDQTAVDDVSVQSCLYADVLAALTMAEEYTLPPPVIDVKYPREQGWAPSDFAWIFEQIGKQKPSSSLSPPSTALEAESSHIAGFEVFDEREVGQYVFWDLDTSNGEEAPGSVMRLLARDEGRKVVYSSVYDNLSQAGISYSAVRTGKETVEAHYDVTQADVVVVNDAKVMLSYDVASGVKTGGTLLLKSGLKDEELEKLPPQMRKTVAGKKIKLVLLDTPADLTPEKENLLLQLAFLRVSGEGERIGGVSEKLSNIDKGLEPQTVQEVAALLDSSLREIPVPETWAEEEITTPALPSSFDPNSFTINAAKSAPEPIYSLKKSIHAAITLSFRESFELQTALRPDLPVTNFIVRVQENKRLTPLSYDRNIFHIEFDLTGTGMTYEIGEALGIHAHNDKEEVLQFIKFYGLDADEIVEVPGRDDGEQVEIRTIFQALSQNIDIFGRPPKKFYEALSEFATDEKEKKELLTLGSAEGATEFKRRAEVDTVTYADILLEFSSAHPSFQDLTKIVSPMKRREYSIASSQQVHPNSVHLLIVVVNWVDSKGRDRFGQATRYLSQLGVGREVVVSVKPSVMKLPGESTKPLIMAGLGTGLAPFRAFVQYRAWQKEQGIPIGAVLLYMGSRHQREEYLYGEEWEAYEAAGVVTFIGKAFSRDQKEKIYIQDRMRESLDRIVRAYVREEGSFYLCGPTWPVPDVQEVLVEAVERGEGGHGKKVDGRRRIEELKEGGRYVLEVY